MSLALVFLVRTLVGLYQGVLLLRLLMQWVRADFRNPAARAVLQLTDPVVRPLRRLLSPAGRMYTGTVAAIVLASIAKLLLVRLLLVGTLGFGGFLPLLVRDLLHVGLNTLFFCVLLYALLSFVSRDGYSPVQYLLASICEPFMAPIRRRIPPIGGLDLTPLWILIAIQALLLVVG